MTQPEHTLQNEILAACSRGDARLFRQNVGEGWTSGDCVVCRGRSRMVMMNPGDVLVRQARRFIAGFPGLSDLGGWVSEVITPEMVGRKIAVYVAAEVKTTRGRVRDEQGRFIAAVKAAGGRAGVVRSVEDARRVLTTG